MSTTYLSLGANKDKRKENIDRAVELLSSRGVIVVKVSSFYETEPVGPIDQKWFLNCVIEAETELRPEALLVLIKSIEKELGRTEAEKWALLLLLSFGPPILVYLVTVRCYPLRKQLLACGQEKQA